MAIFIDRVLTDELSYRKDIESLVVPVLCRIGRRDYRAEVHYNVFLKSFFLHFAQHKSIFNSELIFDFDGQMPHYAKETVLKAIESNSETGEQMNFTTVDCLEYKGDILVYLKCKELNLRDACIVYKKNKQGVYEVSDFQNVESPFLGFRQQMVDFSAEQNRLFFLMRNE